MSEMEPVFLVCCQHGYAMLVLVHVVRQRGSGWMFAIANMDRCNPASKGQLPGRHEQSSLEDQSL